MTPSILVVEPEVQTRHAVGRMLDRSGYHTASAADIGAARAQLAHRSFDLVLCDIALPDGSGLAFVADSEAMPERAPVVVVTAVSDLELARLALNAGAYGYVVKPFTEAELIIAVANALIRRERASRSRRDRWASRNEAVRTLGRMLEARDPEAAPCARRTSAVCGLIARGMGFDGDRVELIRRASALHDVGIVAIPDGILYKRGPLSEDERRVMRRHVEVGHEILAGSGDELLETAATIALTHHERFDGTGYLRGLAGEDIPVEGRITAIAASLGALTSPPGTVMGSRSRRHSS